MFTQALSRELGSRGITVNNVQPGPIDTELNPASGDWAVPQKAPRHSTATGTSMRSPRWWRSSRPGVVVHHRANLTVDGGMNA